MKTTSIKKELHHFIDIIDDRKAEAIYVLFENEINIKDSRKKLILAERAQYLNGDNETHSWDDVKEMTLDKNKRRAL